MALQVFKNICLIGLMFSQSVFAAKILIVTDQPTQQKAKEIKQVIMATPPFSLLKDFSVVIRLLPKESVVCTQPLVDQQKQNSGQSNDSKQDNSQGPQIPDSCKKMFAQAANTSGQNDSDKQATAQAQSQIAAAQRLVVCDAGQALMDISGKENADRTIFVKESDTWAGAGGSSITITTAVPPAGAIHELLHSFGFGDEYEYASPCEADTYCPYVATGYWGNIAVLPDLSPYSSDGSARQQHSSKIPWYSRIKPKTLITTGNVLGTPKKKEIGLHKAHVCDKAESKVTSWKPGSETTVMETLETGFVPEFYYAKIAESLGSRVDSLSSAIVGKSKASGNSTKSEKGVQ
jgi:hypothetical protein